MNPTQEKQGPALLQKKICMIGSFAVGKTSLVSRYIHQSFSEKYMSTVGVKIDRKNIRTPGYDLQMIVWDLNGEDAFQRVRLSYLRGAHGYLLVADGTRANTLETASTLHDQIREAFGPLPFVLAINKSDLRHQWEITEDHEAAFRAKTGSIFHTSARDNDSVEELFLDLALQITGEHS